MELLKDLYIHELKGLHSAERQITRALPRMARAATSERLARGLREALERTREHAARLEKILSDHNETTEGNRCRGMEGMLADGAEMIAGGRETRDASLISTAHRVEHYRLAGYGSARTYAELLGDFEGARLLQLILEEEDATDRKLARLAKAALAAAAET